MGKKLVRGIIGLASILFISLFAGQQVQAIQVEEAWGAPTFIYGGGLSQDEITQTKGELGIQNQTIEEFPVTGADIEKYLNLSQVSTSAMISSVLVERQGNGVHVDIVTPENITKVTEQQYANAAITAGVEDVQIRVASVKPVTGESALTGVYKAFEVNGEDLEQDRMIVAQEELETTTDIEENLDENQSGRFNQIIINIKQTINNYYQENNTTIDAEELRRIIREEIQNADLGQIITEEQINQLVIFFQNYQQTSAIDSEQVRQQLNELGATISDAYEEARDSGWFERIWRSIRDFFTNIWTSFSDSTESE